MMRPQSIGNTQRYSIISLCDSILYYGYLFSGYFRCRSCTVVLESWIPALDTHGRNIYPINFYVYNDKVLHEQIIDRKVKTMTYYDSSIPVNCYYFHSPLIRYDNS